MTCLLTDAHRQAAPSPIPDDLAGNMTPTHQKVLSCPTLSLYSHVLCPSCYKNKVSPILAKPSLSTYALDLIPTPFLKKSMQQLNSPFHPFSAGPFPSSHRPALLPPNLEESFLWSLIPSRDHLIFLLFSTLRYPKNCLYSIMSQFAT